MRLSSVTLALAATGIGWALAPAVDGISIVGTLVPAAYAAHSSGDSHSDGGTSHTDGGTSHTDGGTSHTDGGDSHTDGGGSKGKGARGAGPGRSEGSQGGSSRGAEHVLSGEHSSSEGKGGRGASAGSSGTRGGTPVWSREGIPEVELGRLNVARSPNQVLARQLSEALIAINANPTLYSAATLDAVRAAILSGKVTRVDSPLANLALYRDLLQDGKIDGATFSPALSPADLAAVFLGSASDKTIKVTPETVQAINVILGVSLPAGVTNADVAGKADAVREAIWTEHEGL